MLIAIDLIDFRDWNRNSCWIWTVRYINNSKGNCFHQQLIRRFKKNLSFLLLQLEFIKLQYQISILLCLLISDLLSFLQLPIDRHCIYFNFLEKVIRIIWSNKTNKYRTRSSNNLATKYRVFISPTNQNRERTKPEIERNSTIFNKTACNIGEGRNRKSRGKTYRRVAPA